MYYDVLSNFFVRKNTHHNKKIRKIKPKVVLFDCIKLLQVHIMQSLHEEFTLLSVVSNDHEIMHL